MRVLRNLLWFVASAVLAAACTHASAQTAGFNEFGSWAYEWANGSVRGVLTGPAGQVTSYPMGPSAVGQTVANGAGGVTRSLSVPISLSGGPGSLPASATLTATRTATARQLAQGALSGGRGGLPGAALGLVVTAGLIWAENEWMTPQPVTDGWPWEWSHNGTSWNRSPEQVCTMLAAYHGRTFYSVQWIDVPTGVIRCQMHPTNTGDWLAPSRRAASCPSGFQPVGGVCSSGEESRPATEQEIEDAIVQGLEQTPSAAPQLFDEILLDDLPVLADPPVISGPSSVQSSPSSSSGSAGSTTTQTTYNLTYVNNSYSYTSTTSTTTRDAQGNVTDTKTEDTNPRPEDVPVSVSDTPMPVIPQLYERKYPDGIVGVWQSRKAELQETGFSAALDALLPDIPDGGGCPQFSLPGGDIAGFAFPGGNLGPPCWVWPWVKVVIVITSLFLARSLVFGG